MSPPDRNVTKDASEAAFAAAFTDALNHGTGVVAMHVPFAELAREGVSPPGAQPSAPQVSQEVVDALRGLYQFNAARMTDEDIQQDPRMKKARDALSRVPAEQPCDERIAKLAHDADALGEEVARLQNALAFWLPMVPEQEGPVQDRVANDAFLLYGCDGNLPDSKSAQELGWITLNVDQPSAPSLSDEEIFAALKSVDPLAVRLPPGFKAFACALLAAMEAK